jgi:hypothetical protein
LPHPQEVRALPLGYRSQLDPVRQQHPPDRVGADAFLVRQPLKCGALFVSRGDRGGRQLRILVER